MNRSHLAAGTALGIAAVLSACSPTVRFASVSSNPQAPATSGSTPAATGRTIQTAPPNSSSTAAITGSGALAQLQADIRRVIDRALPSVVEIDTSTGLGSGIVLDDRGDIVTNAHVVGTEKNVTVTTYDGHALEAAVVGSYPANDLAVVRVTSGNGLTPAVFADSSTVHVGDIVIAIGNPLGLSDSVSEGIVSGLGRSQPEGNGVDLNGLIQMTAAINPGNSGGALVNIEGQVVGIPTLVTGSGRGGVATNIGFSIPSNQVVNITAQITSGGTVTHTNQAYLGVTVGGGPNGEALIDSVVSGQPADRAGAKAGWIITKIGSTSTPDPAAVTQVLATHKPGDHVSIVFKLPDGSSKTLSVTLGERPTKP